MMRLYACCNQIMVGAILGSVITFALIRIYDELNRTPMYQSANPIVSASLHELRIGPPVDQEKPSPTLYPHPVETMKLQHVPGLYQQRSVNRQEDDYSMADELRSRVRVLCWLLTTPDNLQKKAIHVYKTWAHRCNKVLFVSSKNATDFVAPVIAVDVEESRKHLTAKTMQAFEYVWNNHKHEADWFMKGDDDTFAVLENLRYFLSDKDPLEPVYYGHHFHTLVKPQGYFSGGGGYVLSYEALRRFAEKGLHDDSLCAKDGRGEDVQFGRCMRNLGVKTGESYDERGASRFNCLSPASHIQGHYPSWYKQYDSHGSVHGVHAISDYAITFHYVQPHVMYSLEYYTYHLKVYGIRYKNIVKIHDYYLNRNQTLT